jgi:hypothetical protein
MLIDNGKFPSEAGIRRYGHNLWELLRAIDTISVGRQLADPHVRLPVDASHCSIIDILTDFASNVTRYYNIDVMTNGVGGTDPIARWYREVVLVEFDQSVPFDRKKKVVAGASLAAKLIGGISSVRHTDETGDSIDTVADASMRTGIIEEAGPYVRVRVLQLVRFVGNVVSEIGAEAFRKGFDIPYMSEFFGRFNQDDKEFRKRKTW